VDSENGADQRVHRSGAGTRTVFCCRFRVRLSHKPPAAP